MITRVYRQEKKEKKQTANRDPNISMKRFEKRREKHRQARDFDRANKKFLQYLFDQPRSFLNINGVFGPKNWDWTDTGKF